MSWHELIACSVGPNALCLDERTAQLTITEGRKNKTKTPLVFYLTCVQHSPSSLTNTSAL